MLTTLIAFAVVLGVLVFLHEFGHFALAKRAGVQVETFSFGFGPRLVGWKRGETDYRISAVPLGGYVKMVGEDPQEEEGEREDSFVRKSVWARMKIVLAGPLMNLALPFLLMPLVYLMGVDQPAFLSSAPVADWVVPDSPAQRAGFQAGDRILQVQGGKTATWEQTLLAFAANVGKPVEVEILRGESSLRLQLTPESVGLGAPFTGLLQEMQPVVGELEPDSPAQKAGLEAGDRIVALDQQPIHNWEQMSEIIRTHPGQTLLITYQRGEQSGSAEITPKAVPLQRESGLRKTLRVVFAKLGLKTRSTPEAGPVVGQIGIRYLEHRVTVRYGLLESVKKGSAYNGQMIVLTFEALGQLLTDFSRAKESLGGPIAIAKMTGDAARHGLSDLLRFMAMLSLSLGILNLLPIPVLDGGHVLFLSLEAIRRKPLSVRIRDVAQQVGFILLMGFILYISYNDVMRLVP